MRASPESSNSVIKPRQPDSDWLRSFLEPSLVTAPPYKIDTPVVSTKLDQNESPWDWPREVKEKIVAKLLDSHWNRYPSAFADDLVAKVAAYAGVEANSVLLGPGSNYLCSLVLSTLTKKIQGKVVIARPSFALYESHCTYEGIPYEPWPLNEDLEYDTKLLPELPPHSLVIFASPNNPVGNVLSKKTFETLLSKYPQTIFVADEAYFEYAEEPYTALLAKHANLILIRTFSKTLGCAGVRIGYIIAAPAYIEPIKKLRLPYLLNHFSLVAGAEILDNPATRDYLQTTVRNAINQRQKVYEGLLALAKQGGFRVKNSQANFLLLRWSSTEAAMVAYQRLIKAGILVRNVAASPGLAGCLRITLGDEVENEQLLKAFREQVGRP